MSHLDEGTLHALLDGELETHEVAEIQAHLNSCSACGLRLREVKEFLAEADRLIAEVDLGSGSAPSPRPAPAQIPAAPDASPVLVETEPRREPVPSRSTGSAEGGEWEPWNEPPPPVLLIPDNESAAERRMRRMRRFGWAAILLVIAGAGFVEARKIMPVGPLPADTMLAKTQPVVSPEETAPARQEMAAGRADSTPARRTTTLADARSTAPKAKVVAPAKSPPAKPAPSAAATKDTDLADAGAAGANTTLASRDDAPAEQSDQVDETAPAAADSSVDSEAAGTEDLSNVRTRASEALAQLDRERRLKQAAAATAALDAQRRRAAATSTRPAASSAGAVAPVPAPAPTPPTLEQRAQIYLRIGLDEASRQLGGPAHVIEGLSPLFMGLAQGTAVPGAEAGRPVVRVVYQDSQGRLILLDQQRLRQGQTAPTASATAWTLGGTAMWLHGEAPAEVLRLYRNRVR